VFAAIELARFRKKLADGAGGRVVVFEIVTVLALRAHYTMDVFTGLVAALWVATVCDAVWSAHRTARCRPRLHPVRQGRTRRRPYADQSWKKTPSAAHSSFCGR